MPATLVIGSVYRFVLTALKDGAVWDLSDATVTLYLKKPSGTILTKSATVHDPDNGGARFDCATTDLDSSGLWSRSWRVVDGSVTQESLPILFTVVDSP